MEQKESLWNRLFGKKSNSCCCGSYKIERKGEEKDNSKSSEESRNPTAKKNEK